MSDDRFEKFCICALVVFAGTAGVIALTAMLLSTLHIAVDTADALAAATPGGIGITIAIRKGTGK
jgi:hypothetical protein